MIKALVILLLTIAIFGSAAYWTYELFMRPSVELKQEKSLPAQPPPPDPSLEDFVACVAIQKTGSLPEARAALERFIEQNPQSTKLEEAKDLLGGVNTSLFLSPARVPEKVEYTVKSGDVLSKVAARMKTTPELIMRSNQMSSTMLRIGQKLLVSPGEFSLVINKRALKVILLNRGKFFKQYSIQAIPGPHAPPAKKGSVAQPLPQKMAGKVTEKIAWAPSGQRVTFSDKEYGEAAHWIVSNLGTNTLYSMPDLEKKTPPQKPPGGIGLAPEHMEELAALLRKGDPVTIEQ